MTSVDRRLLSHSKTNMKILPGLEGLEAYVEHDIFIYILRELYRIIRKSGCLKENKRQLRKRIQQFEKESELPGFLSAISIDKLLKQLENAQYRYPISKKEINFPTFH